MVRFRTQHYPTADVTSSATSAFVDRTVSCIVTPSANASFARTSMSYPPRYTPAKIVLYLDHNRISLLKILLCIQSTFIFFVTISDKSSFHNAPL